MGNDNIYTLFDEKMQQDSRRKSKNNRIESDFVIDDYNGNKLHVKLFHNAGGGKVLCTTDGKQLFTDLEKSWFISGGGLDKTGERRLFPILYPPQFTLPEVHKEHTDKTNESENHADAYFRKLGEGTPLGSEHESVNQMLGIDTNSNESQNRIAQTGWAQKGFNEKQNKIKLYKEKRDNFICSHNIDDTIRCAENGWIPKERRYLRWNEKDSKWELNTTKTGQSYLILDIKGLIGDECLKNYTAAEDSLMSPNTTFDEFVSKLMKGVSEENRELHEMKTMDLTDFLTKIGFKAEFESRMNNLISMDQSADNINVIYPGNGIYEDTQNTIQTGYTDNNNVPYDIDLSSITTNDSSLPIYDTSSHEDYLWPNNYNDNNFDYSNLPYNNYRNEFDGFSLENYGQPGIEYVDDVENNDSYYSFSSKPNDNSYYTQTYTPQQISNNVNYHTNLKYPYTYHGRNYYF